MKYRTGFVTNSSSSSFLVYFKPEDRERFSSADPAVLAMYDYLIQTFGDNLLKNEEELEEHYIESYCGDCFQDTSELDALFDRAPWIKKEYESKKKMLEKGFSLIEMDVDHRNKSLKKLIVSLHNGETFVVEKTD